MGCFIVVMHACAVVLSLWSPQDILLVAELQLLQRECWRQWHKMSRCDALRHCLPRSLETRSTQMRFVVWEVTCLCLAPPHFLVLRRSHHGVRVTLIYPRTPTHSLTLSLSHTHTHTYTPSSCNCVEDTTSPQRSPRHCWMPSTRVVTSCISRERKTHS